MMQVIRPVHIHFVRRLIGNTKCLHEAFQREIDFMGPNLLLMVSLFSAFGEVITNQFDSFDDSTKAHLFRYIELGMNPNDDLLATAVATGLIEALISESDKDLELWKKIKEELGPESRAYADAWNKLCGVDK